MNEIRPNYTTGIQLTVIYKKEGILARGHWGMALLSNWAPCRMTQPVDTHV